MQTAFFVCGAAFAVLMLVAGGWTAYMTGLPVLYVPLFAVGACCAALLWRLARGRSRPAYSRSAWSRLILISSLGASLGAGMVHAYSEDGADWSFGEPDVVADAPVRVEPGVGRIPVLCLLRRGGPLIYLGWRSGFEAHRIELQSVDPMIASGAGREGGAIQPLPFLDALGARHQALEGIFAADWHTWLYVDRADLKAYEGRTVEIRVLVDGRPATRTLHGVDRAQLLVELGTRARPAPGGWWRGDQHVHTELTDNSNEYGLPLDGYPELLRARGLDYVAFTDHAYDLRPGSWALVRELCSRVPGKAVEIPCVAGEELHVAVKDFFLPSVTVDHSAHLLVLDPPRLLQTGRSLLNAYAPTRTLLDVAEDLERMAEQATASQHEEDAEKSPAVILAHPYGDGPEPESWDADMASSSRLAAVAHGIEVLNGAHYIRYGTRVVGHRFSARAIDLWVRHLIDGRMLSAIGNSDAHCMEVGVGFTYIRAAADGSAEKSPEPAAVVDAIKGSRTVASSGPFVTLQAFRENQLIGSGPGAGISPGPVEVVVAWAPEDGTEHGEVFRVELYWGVLHDDEVRVPYLLPERLPTSVPPPAAPTPSPVPTRAGRRPVRTPSPTPTPTPTPTPLPDPLWHWGEPAKPAERAVGRNEVRWMLAADAPGYVRAEVWTTSGRRAVTSPIYLRP